MFTPIRQAFTRTNYSTQKSPAAIDPVYKVLENNKICLCVDSAKWEELVEQNSNLTIEYSYYCDTNAFVKHYLTSTPTNQYYLVEGKVAHGTGEYDNFVVKINDKGDNTITQYFKGYLQKLNRNTSDSISCNYRFFVDIKYTIA